MVNLPILCNVTATLRKPRPSLFSIETALAKLGLVVNLLSQHFLPAIRALSGEFFMFQQDTAPAAHRANDTVKMLRLNTPEIISPTLWPPNSQYLNPVDYKIWGVLQELAYKTIIRDMDHLKERLVEE